MSKPFNVIDCPRCQVIGIVPEDASHEQTIAHMKKLIDCQVCGGTHYLRPTDAYLFVYSNMGHYPVIGTIGDGALEFAAWEINDLGVEGMPTKQDVYVWEGAFLAINHRLEKWGRFRPAGPDDFERFGFPVPANDDPDGLALPHRIIKGKDEDK